MKGLEIVREAITSGLAVTPRALFFFFEGFFMSTLTRIATNPVGMARLVTNYARLKEMESNGLEIPRIAEIFDENPAELQNFVDVADAFVSGEKSLSLDVTTKSRDAFKIVAEALSI
jgi:hypothetical protein